MNMSRLSEWRYLLFLDGVFGVSSVALRFLAVVAEAPLTTGASPTGARLRDALVNMLIGCCKWMHVVKGLLYRVSRGGIR